MLPKLAALFLCSCGPLVLTPEVDARDIVRDAVAAVNAASNAELVKQAPGGIPVTLGGPECGSTVHVNKIPKAITLSPECAKYGDEQMQVMLVHEIGHAFGLADVDRSDSVMFPRVVIGRTLAFAAKSLARELDAKDTGILPPND